MLRQCIRWLKANGTIVTFIAVAGSGVGTSLLATQLASFSRSAPWLPLTLILSFTLISYVVALEKLEPVEDASSQGSIARFIFPDALSASARRLDGEPFFRLLVLLTFSLAAGSVGCVVVRWPFELLQVALRHLPGWGFRGWIFAIALVFTVLLAAADDFNEMSGWRFASLAIVGISTSFWLLPRSGPYTKLDGRIEQTVGKRQSVSYLKRSREVSAHQPELLERGDGDFSFWETRPQQSLEPTPLRLLFSNPRYYDGLPVAVAGHVVSIEPIGRQDGQRAVYRLTLTSIEGKLPKLIVRLSTDSPRAPDTTCDLFAVSGLPVAYDEHTGDVVLLSYTGHCMEPGVKVVPSEIPRPFAYYEPTVRDAPFTSPVEESAVYRFLQSHIVHATFSDGVYWVLPNAEPSDCYSGYLLLWQSQSDPTAAKTCGFAGLTR
jgi:hypothetical protein